jgi:hypothetical protein
MLQRNGPIAPDDVRLLSKWLEYLGYAVMVLLEGCDVGEAFSPYASAYPLQAERLRNTGQGSLPFDGDLS